MHVGILVLADCVVRALRIRAWHIVELIGVVWISEDIVAVHSSQSPLVLVTHSEDQLHEVFLTHASHADTLLCNHLFAEPEFSVFVLQHGKEWVKAFDRNKFFKYSSFIKSKLFLEAPVGVYDDIEDYTSEKEEYKGRCRCQLAEKLAELVLLEGEQVAVLGDRHYVLEHLLV